MSHQDRKHFLTPAVRPKGSILVAQEYSVTTGYDDRREQNLRVEACPKNENNDGWLQMTASKNGEKRTTSVYVCLNRAQAIALRDLLNNAFGGSSRVARTIEGSIYTCGNEQEVK